MVAADERVAVNFALAEKRALMRTAAFEGAPARRRPDERDVHAVRCDGEGSVPGKFVDFRDAKKGYGLHVTVPAGIPMNFLSKRPPRVSLFHPESTRPSENSAGEPAKRDRIAGRWHLRRLERAHHQRLADALAAEHGLDDERPEEKRRPVSDVYRRQRIGADKQGSDPSDETQ